MTDKDHINKVIKEGAPIEPYETREFFNEDGSNYFYSRREAVWHDVGIRVGYKYTIEKAIKWLEEQEEIIGISFQNDFFDRFRKAMEG